MDRRIRPFGNIFSHRGTADRENSEPRTKAATHPSRLPKAEKTEFVLGGLGHDFTDRQRAPGGPAMHRSPDRDPVQSCKAFINVWIDWIR